MKYTRFLAAIFALSFMAACGGISPTGVDDDDECPPEAMDEQQCRGMIGSGG